MTYLGAYTAGSTLTHLFTSRATSGVPTALVSTASASVYKDGGTTQATALASLTTNFDSVAGLNRLVVDSSASAAFFTADSEFAVVLDNGTVNGASVVGEVIVSFSLNDGTLPSNSITSSTVSSDALSARSIGLVAATHPGVTIPTVTNVTNVSNATIAAGSNVTVGASTITVNANLVQWRGTQPNTLSSGRVDVDASNVSVGLKGVTHPGATIPTVTNVTNVSNATIAAGSNVTVGVIVANALTATAIASNAITSAKIAANAIGASQIAAASLTSSKFGVSAYSEIARSVLTASLVGSGVPHATRNVAAALRAVRNRVDVGLSVATVYAEDDTTSAWTGSVTTGAFPVNTINPA